MSRILSAAAGAAVAAILTFAPTGAAPATVTVSATAPSDSGLYVVRSIAVAYGDVDLGTSQGAAALLERISAASRAVCGGKANRRMNEARTKLFNTCIAQTTASAVKTVNAPQLTEVAAAH